jgi:hypothetical protein
MSTSVCPASCHSANYFIIINHPIIDAVLILTALLNNKLNKKYVLCIHIRVNVVPNGLKICYVKNKNIIMNISEKYLIT